MRFTPPAARFRPERPRFYWRTGKTCRVRLPGGLLHDMGRMFCKENCRIWCQRHGYDFIDGDANNASS